MPGVTRELAEHCLRVDPKAKHVKEHLRQSAVEKRKAIGEEVARLLAAEFIREIYLSEWLANVVMVPKKGIHFVCVWISSISIGPARKIISLSPASTRLSTRLRDVNVCPF